MTSQGLHIITGNVIQEMLNELSNDLIDIVEKAYRAHAAGQTVNPDSYFLRFADSPLNRIIALPAAFTGADNPISGLKWIASYPANLKQGLPRASAVLVLNDAKTGFPLALLESGRISAMRTAASAVLGARAIAKAQGGANNPAISFVGGGVIARSICRMFIQDGWQPRQLMIHDLNPVTSAEFGEKIGSECPDMTILQASLDEALNADIVVFATSAGVPYVTSSYCFRPQQIILNISLRDLAPEHILAANNIFDDVEHCIKANTSPHLAEMLVGNRNFVTGTVVELIDGTVSPDAKKPTIYSPFGMGIVDLAVGQRLLQQAITTGKSIVIDSFFGEMDL